MIAARENLKKELFVDTLKDIELENSNELHEEDDYPCSTKERTGRHLLSNVKIEKIYNSQEQLLATYSIQECLRCYKKFQINPAEELIRAVHELLNYKPEGGHLDKDGPYYAPGDEDAPFFTEACLYNLVGKDEARSILAHSNAVKVALRAFLLANGK